jgi:hypothetical protein
MWMMHICYRCAWAVQAAVGGQAINAVIFIYQAVDVAPLAPRAGYTKVAMRSITTPASYKRSNAACAL